MMSSFGFVLHTSAAQIIASGLNVAFHHNNMIRVLLPFSLFENVISFYDVEI